MPMKKYSLLFILLLINFWVLAQTSLDSLLFKKINIYRNSKGLESWVWDQNVWEASHGHNVYLMKLGDCTHYEEGNEDTYTGGNRLIQHDVYWYITRENCAVTDRYNEEGDEEQSDKILKQWINSPSHHETLLCNKTKYGAVSTTHTSKFQWSVKAWWTYSTLNVWI
jgi:uncharacterized protein YkwD